MLLIPIKDIVKIKVTDNATIIYTKTNTWVCELEQRIPTNDEKSLFLEITLKDGNL